MLRAEKVVLAGLNAVTVDSLVDPEMSKRKGSSSRRMSQPFKRKGIAVPRRFQESALTRTRYLLSA